MANVLLASTPETEDYPALEIYSDDLSMFKFPKRILNYIVPDTLANPEAGFSKIDIFYELGYDEKNDLAQMRCSVRNDNIPYNGIQFEDGLYTHSSKDFFLDMINESKDEKEYLNTNLMIQATHKATEDMARKTFINHGIVIQGLCIKGNGMIMSRNKAIALFNEIELDSDMNLYISNCNDQIYLDKIVDPSIKFVLNGRSIEFLPIIDKENINHDYVQKVGSLYSMKSLKCIISPRKENTEDYIKVPDFDEKNEDIYKNECFKLLNNKEETKNTLFDDFDLF